MTHSIFEPMSTLMLLTFVVWVFMYIKRFSYIIPNKIPAQDLASPEQLNAALPESINRPSNNLKNLFELPVIFYTLCIALHLTGAVDGASLYMAWAFVMLRALHSAIQCTVNIVLLRFAAYALSSLVLLVMVMRFAWTLL